MGNIPWGHKSANTLAMAVGPDINSSSWGCCVGVVDVVVDWTRNLLRFVDGTTNRNLVGIEEDDDLAWTNVRIG
jgi:hypothetical protein